MFQERQVSDIWHLQEAACDFVDFATVWMLLRCEWEASDKQKQSRCHGSRADLFEPQNECCDALQCY